MYFKVGESLNKENYIMTVYRQFVRIIPGLVK